MFELIKPTPIPHTQKENTTVQRTRGERSIAFANVCLRGGEQRLERRVLQRGGVTRGDGVVLCRLGEGRRRTREGRKTKDERRKEDEGREREGRRRTKEGRKTKGERNETVVGRVNEGRWVEKKRITGKKKPEVCKKFQNR